MMRIRFFKSLMLIATLGIVATSCVSDKCTSTQTYIQYTPIYKSMDEIRGMIEVKSPQELKKPGKLWIRDQFLFINEYGLGIHIYNCSNKQNPKAVSFIQIPGNVDMAVRNNTLYVDQFTDLVVFDISDLNNIKEVNRIENTFPDNVSVHEFANRWQVDQSQGIAIDWIEEEVEVDCDSYGGNDFIAERTLSEAIDIGSNQPSNSQGGSMARFTIMGDYLYTIDDRTMRLFGLLNDQSPEQGQSVEMPWGIETIFPYYRKQEPYLFIGANNGMYIMDNSNPLSPTMIGQMNHIESCDPVVAQNDHAYVTLRSGNACAGWTDQLEIVDISDLKNPKNPIIHSMTNPYGLGIDGNTLFICDGRDGLKVYDLTENPAPSKLKELEHFSGFSAYDVIASKGTLYLTSSDGFILFDYSNPKNIKQLGEIKVNSAL